MTFCFSAPSSAPLLRSGCSGCWYFAAKVALICDPVLCYKTTTTFNWRRTSERDRTSCEFIVVLLVEVIACRRCLIARLSPPLTDFTASASLLLRGRLYQTVQVCSQEDTEILHVNLKAAFLLVYHDKCVTLLYAFAAVGDFWYNMSKFAHHFVH